ncbi:MAG: metallophosphoesterase [Desulfobulbus sp.]|nr:metallophosphoesterase [Desulfobulbus sp.]
MRIGLIADQTGTEDLDRAYRMLAAGVETLRRQRLDGLIHLGDLVESGRPESLVQADFARGRALLGRAGLPWRIAPGDHDLNPPTPVPNATDRSRERLFRALAAPHLPGSPRLYGSFDVHGCHFILLNAQEHLHTDPRWGNVFLAQLSATQQAWLRADLEGHRNARAIAVFLHQPLWCHWSAWQPVHELLRDYQVDAVVAAHVHTDRDDGVLDGIRYLVLGAAGGMVQHVHPDAAGTAQVAVLSLGDGPARLELLDAVTGTRLPLTPRADAERLQALGYLLDNLEVSFQGDGVDSRSDWPMGAGRATLRLDGLGNPIDLPVEVAIDARGEGVSLVDPGFAPGLCRGRADGVRCELAAGANVLLSNPFLARARTSAGTPAWSVRLETAGTDGAAIAPHLELAVSLGFSGEQERLRVQRRLRCTPAGDCGGRR